MLTTKSLYVHLKVKMIHDTRKLETNVTIMKTKPYLRAMHKKIAKKNSGKLERVGNFLSPRHFPRIKLLLRQAKKSWKETGLTLGSMILEITKHSNTALENILSLFKIHHGIAPAPIHRELALIVYQCSYTQIQIMQNGMIVVVELNGSPFVRQHLGLIYLTTLIWWPWRYFWNNPYLVQ